MPRSNEEYINLGHNSAINHDKTQAKLYQEHLSTVPSFTRQLDEFFKTRLIGFAWHYLKSRFGKRHPYQYYPKDGDNGVYPIQTPKSKATFALLSDWANDTEESDRIAALAAEQNPDYTLHLGDVYFVGTQREIEINFTAPHASWPYGPSGSLVIPGNHEMYSNGNAFYKNLLTAMYAHVDGIKKTQKAGFFCLENEHWRIIGIDTGYTSVGHPLLEVAFSPDCALRQEQLDWLRDEVKLGDSSDKRGLIFLSHHPIISGFRHSYNKPAEQIEGILGDAVRPVIWLWGHEHRLIWYKHQKVGKSFPIHGRCIGIGGMPVETSLPKKETDQQKMLYYDQRIRKRIKRVDVGFNGYVILTLEGANLQLIYKDIKDNLLMTEDWSVDLTTGELTGDLKPSAMLTHL